jgi:hypothetical protein
MSWLALLLVGVGLTDLVFSLLVTIGRPAPVMPHVLAPCVGAAASVVLAVLADVRTGRDIVALVLIVVAVVGWGQTVTLGFRDDRPWVPLTVLGGSVFLAILMSPFDDDATQGVLGDWLTRTPWGLVHGMSPTSALLLAGVFLVQLSTGNVIVRLVLAATGTLDPARAHARESEEPPLKGGRLLGPMERVFIVGMALAGQVTAASIVVAAKGLLRYPELQAARDPEDRGPGIHAMTEYFLLGTFLSWMVAFGSLVLVS